MSYAPPLGCARVGEDVGVEGVCYRADFLPRQCADRLLATALAQLAWQRERLTMFGRVSAAPRLSAWYGEAGTAYRYSGATRTATPWPGFLARLAAAAGRAVGAKFNYVLVNRYRDGRDTLGWHADDEADLGPAPTIATVSVGATRTLRLRPRGRRQARQGRGLGCELAHGSLLLMWGDCQRDYKHCVPRTAQRVGERVSFTFRHTRGRAAAGAPPIADRRR